MKLTATTYPGRESLGLEWHMPGAPHGNSLYILPAELTPKGYPHLVTDCGRIATFWGNRLIVHHSVCDLAGDAQDGVCPTSADVIHCDTNRLLAVLRILNERKVSKTVLETTRLRGRYEEPLYTVAQLHHHANLRNPEWFGETLRFFHQTLVGGDRTFKHLIRDLSRYIDRAKIFANKEEFYFDGRIPGGLGFNGGIVPHINQHSYGIHT